MNDITDSIKKLNDSVKNQWNSNPIFRWCSYLCIGSVLVPTINHIYNRIYRKFKNMPPGPIGLPFLGSLFSVGNNPIEFYAQMHSTYGPIACYNLGLTRCVIINDIKTAKLLWANDDIGTAKFVGGWDAFDHRPFVMMETSPETWFRRKTTQAMLLSLTDSRFVDHIARKVLQDNVFPIMDKEPKAFEGKKYYCNVAFNVTFAALFGEDAMLGVDNEDYLRILDLIDEVSYYQSMSVFIDLIFGANGKLSHFICESMSFPQKLGETMKIFYNLNKKYYDLNRDKNGLNKQTYMEKIDEYLKNKRSKNKLEVDYTEFKILNDITMALGISVESTVSTLEFILVLLSRHPDLQRRICDELQTNFGGSGDTNGQGKGTANFELFHNGTLSKCVLMKAFIMETLRLYPPMAQSLFRVAPEDLKVKGYTIPKGTLICYNSHEMFRDNDLKINLDLWINEKTGHFKMYEQSKPFGLGKRYCPGKSLAIKNLMFLVGMMLLRYEFIAINDEINHKNNAIIDSAKPLGLITMVGENEIPIKIRKR